MEIETARILWVALFAGIGGGIGAGLAQMLKLKYPNLPSYIPIIIFVLCISLGGQISRSYPPPFVTTDEFDRQLAEIWTDESNFLALLAADHPDVRGMVEVRGRKAYIAGGLTRFKDEMAVIGQELGGTYLLEYIAFADDESIGSFSAAFVGQGQYLIEHDLELCFYWLNGGKDDLGSSLNFPPTLTSAMTTAMSELIRSGSKDRRLVREQYSAEEFKGIAESLVLEISKMLSPKDISFEGMGNPVLVVTEDGRQRTCKTTVALHEVLLNKAPEERAKIYRALYQAAMAS